MKTKWLAILMVGFASLILFGCSNTDERIADRVVKKIEETYDGDFEVTALGNRYGTETNDTVTVFVNEKNEDVLFKVVMNMDDVIEFEDYPRRKLAKQLETIFIEELEKEGIASTTRLNIISPAADDSIEIELMDFIQRHTPEYFVGDVIVKEKAEEEALIHAYANLYERLNDIRFQTNIWVISSEQYDEVVEEFNENPGVSDTWFEAYDVIDRFYLDIDEEGIQTDSEKLEKVLMTEIQG